MYLVSDVAANCSRRIWVFDELEDTSVKVGRDQHSKHNDNSIKDVVPGVIRPENDGGRHTG